MDIPPMPGLPVEEESHLIPGKGAVSNNIPLNLSMDQTWPEDVMDLSSVGEHNIVDEDYGIHILDSESALDILDNYQDRIDMDSRGFSPIRSVRVSGCSEGTEHRQDDDGIQSEVSLSDLPDNMNKALVDQLNRTLMKDLVEVTDDNFSIFDPLPTSDDSPADQPASYQAKSLTIDSNLTSTGGFSRHTYPRFCISKTEAEKREDKLKKAKKLTPRRPKSALQKSQSGDLVRKLIRLRSAEAMSEVLEKAETERKTISYRKEEDINPVHSMNYIAVHSPKKGKSSAGAYMKRTSPHVDTAAPTKTSRVETSATNVANAKFKHHVGVVRMLADDKDKPRIRNDDAQLLLAEVYQSGVGSISADTGKGLRYAISSAEQGNPEAMYRVALAYAKGEPFVKDPIRASEFMRAAADAGHFDALNILGKWYKDGVGMAQSDKKAFQCWQLADLKGHTHAAYLLGECYLNGKGTAKNHGKALVKYRSAARRRHPAALRRLGIMYRDGIGIKRNIELALEFFTLAAKFGDADSQAEIGKTYLEKPIKGEWKLEEGVAWLQAAADQGCIHAYSLLGRCYEKGMKGLVKDGSMAFKYYELGADAGIADCQVELGVMWREGNAVATRNPVLACQRFRQAAEQFHPRGMYEYGRCFFRGEGVPKDYGQAVRWFRLSAMYKDKNGHYSFGWCCLNGIGIEKSPIDAFKNFKQAAKKGHAAAQSQYGVMLQTGGITIATGKRLKPDPKRAVMYYKRAIAAENIKEAQNNLGVCYHYGFGLEKNISKAIFYYDVAAKRMDSNAQNNLGRCYFNGDGVKRDYKKAFKLFLMAAGHGHIDAQNNLASCYENGHGIKANPSLAARWYKIASESGDPYAFNNLANCYEHGIGVKKDLVQAANFYYTGAELGHTEAMNSYAHCLEFGYGVKRNIPKAFEMYKKSASLGDKMGNRNMGRMYESGIGVPANQEMSLLYYTRFREIADGNGSENSTVATMLKMLSHTRFDDATHEEISRAIRHGLNTQAWDSTGMASTGFASAGITEGTQGDADQSDEDTDQDLENSPDGKANGEDEDGKLNALSNLQAKSKKVWGSLAKMVGDDVRHNAALSNYAKTTAKDEDIDRKILNDLKKDINLEGVMGIFHAATAARRISTTLHRAVQKAR